MTQYIYPHHLSDDKTFESDHDTADEAFDAWQQAGLVARHLVRRLRIPAPTAILIVEQAGFHTAGVR